MVSILLIISSQPISTEALSATSKGQDIDLYFISDDNVSRRLESLAERIRKLSIFCPNSSASALPMPSLAPMSQILFIIFSSLLRLFLLL